MKKKSSKSGRRSSPKPHGYYCWRCERRRANEKFSGKGHALHICKECASEQKQEVRLRKRIKSSPRPLNNLYANLTESLPEEVVENLFCASSIRIERIVSEGHVSPPDFWYDQVETEWVILLRGAATIEFQGERQLCRMLPGDYVVIPPHKKHRVIATSNAKKTIWLAVFVKE